MSRNICDLFHLLKPNLPNAKCSSGAVLHSAEQLRVHFACLLTAVPCANWVIVCANASGNSDAMCTIVVISCENTGLQRAHFMSMNCFKTGQMNGRNNLFIHA